MCQIIENSKNKEKDFENLLEYLLESVKDKIKEYAEDPNFNRLMLIQNYIIFFMVLVLNLKSYISLIKIIFQGRLKFFSELRDSISGMKTSKRKKLLSILSNIFLEEYKDVFFNKNDADLENLFIEQQTDFSNICSETVTFYDDTTYKKMFQILLKFDIRRTKRWRFLTGDPANPRKRIRPYLSRMPEVRSR